MAALGRLVTTRPKTDASFVTFTNGNSKRNAEALLSWIRERDFKKSQFLALALNETGIEEGDNMLTLFYRDKPLMSNEVTFDDL